MEMFKYNSPNSYERNTEVLLLFNSIPFDEDCAYIAATISKTHSQWSIENMDLMIAATAIRNELLLISNDKIFRNRQL
jgi:predicted nucleic acid-binding protein